MSGEPHPNNSTRIKMKVGNYYKINEVWDNFEEEGIYKVLEVCDGCVTVCQLIWQNFDDEYVIGHIFRAHTTGHFKGWIWKDEWIISEEEVKKYKLESL